MLTTDITMLKVVMLLLGKPSDLLTGTSIHLLAAPYFGHMRRSPICKVV